MNSSDVIILLLSISLMLFLARSLGEILRHFRQPIIIGEILAGILLGPTLFGNLFPDIYNYLFTSSASVNFALDGITNIAVIMLLLVSGLEVDLTLMIKQGKLALMTSVMGIVFPFIIGFGAAYLFPEYMGIQEPDMRLVFALFIGTALSITALPVVARTLMDLNIFRSEIGLIIVASAMLNDLVGWIIFSIILGMIGSGAHGLSFGTTVWVTSLFILFTLLIGRKIITRIMPVIQEKLAFPGGVLNFVLILGFLCAAFTEFIGIHAIFGAFIIGIAIGDSPSLSENTREIIQQFITNIFAPLFFVSIGLRINFVQNFDLMLVIIFIVLAFAGKVIGCGLGAFWSGMSKNDSLAVGFGMNSRGAMEIILGLLALQFGLIQEKVFVALVIMALFTSVASAPLMSIFLSDKKKYTFSRLLNPKNIFFSEAVEKKNAIRELCTTVEKEAGLSGEQIFEEVWKREEEFPTGIANSLAIPHARLPIKKPIIAVSYNSTGIDFGAADGLSKIIVLLLTPKSSNELQLQLLAEIAGVFKDKEKIQEILTFSKKEEFASKLTKLASLSA